MGQPNYRNGFRVTLHPHMLDRPLSWRRPQMIFVNSMSDLFHEDVPVSFIQKVLATIGRAHWHTFQVLTKRAERLEELASKLPWPSNLWMGVSVEREDYAHRIDRLRGVPSNVRFLSLEPLLGPLVALDLRDIDWVIVGGESGHRARPMDEAWVLAIMEQCDRARVPFFFKQWGGRNKKQAGRLLNGSVWDAMPSPLRHP
jgi:protein gp37